jgi:hypothetical protein
MHREEALRVCRQRTLSLGDGCGNKIDKFLYLLHRNTKHRGLVTVSLHIDLGILELMIAGYILQFQLSTQLLFKYNRIVYNLSLSGLCNIATTMVLSYAKEEIVSDCRAWG